MRGEDSFRLKCGKVISFLGLYSGIVMRVELMLLLSLLQTLENSFRTCSFQEKGWRMQRKEPIGLTPLFSSQQNFLRRPAKRHSLHSCLSWFDHTSVTNLDQKWDQLWFRLFPNLVLHFLSRNLLLNHFLQHLFIPDKDHLPLILLPHFLLVLGPHFHPSSVNGNISRLKWGTGPSYYVASPECASP